MEFRSSSIFLDPHRLLDHVVPNNFLVDYDFVLKGVLSFKVFFEKHTYFLKHECLNLLCNEHTHE